MTWKQPGCPLVYEWITKLWYICTMEYYSAMKRNAFESVLMRWMSLEPIIQSEVSWKVRGKYFINCFSDCAKAFACMNHKITVGKFFKDMGIPGHLTCLLRNLYAGQEATIWTRHGPMDWFKIGKGVHQGCILSPCLLILYLDWLLLSLVQLFVIPWTVACQASLSFTISQSLLKFIAI